MKGKVLAEEKGTELTILKSDEKGCISYEEMENTIREKEQALMWEFYEKVRKIPGVIVYGDFSGKERCPIVTLNFEDVDSAELSDALFTEYGISTRPGVHCAPLMHEALGTVGQGAVRFSFSHYNTEKEILTAVEALKELAEL